MADQPFLASNSFNGDGVTTVWEFSFEGLAVDAPLASKPYIDSADVRAELIVGEGDTQITTPQAFLFETANSLRIEPAVPVGTVLRIYRATENRFPLVNYQDLQSVGASDLDLANRQAVYIVQEARDAARGAGNVSAETLALAQGAATAAAAAAALAVAQGILVLGDYAAGLTFTTRNQAFRYQEDLYLPSSGLPLPYTTDGSGVSEIANFQIVGDVALRSDLAAVGAIDKAAGIVAFTPGLAYPPESIGSAIARSRVNLSSIGSDQSSLEFCLANFAEVEIDIPLTLSAPVVVPESVSRLFGSGEITFGAAGVISLPDTLGFSSGVTLIALPPGVADATYVDGVMKVTVSDVSGFAVGNLVMLAGSSEQTFYARIARLDGSVVALDRSAQYSIGTSPILTVVNTREIVVEGLHLSGASRLGRAFAIGRTSGVTIRKCKAEDLERVLTTTGVGNRFEQNTAHNCATMVLGFDAGSEVVESNHASQCDQGVRVIKGEGWKIHGNIVEEGSNQQFGIGIEVATNGSVEDKNCNHSIMFNKVFRANHGVAGSGIGGIHLNFNAKRNKVMFNECKFNSFGINLENSCEQNIIGYNTCSYNDGYYGVGIELDADSSYNDIVGNTCEYNVGSTTAGDSCGIELRNGPKKNIPEIDNLPHPCVGNSVHRNFVRFNGGPGIRANGVDNTVSENELVQNNTRGANMSSRADLMSDDTTNCIFIANKVRSSGGSALYGMHLQGFTNLSVLHNSINVGGGQVNAIRGEHGPAFLSTTLTLSGNNIVSAATERAITTFGIDGVLMPRIYAEGNTISHVSNGFPALSMAYCNGFSSTNNKFVGANSTTSYAFSTGRTGYAASQADSAAADVATLRTDVNALLAKLRAGGVIST